MWGLEATGALYGEVFQAEGARKQRRVGCCAHTCASAEESDRLAGRAGGRGCRGSGAGEGPGPPMLWAVAATAGRQAGVARGLLAVSQCAVSCS